MPPDTTFDTDEPDTMPFAADDTTATLAGAAAQMAKQRHRYLHHPIVAARLVEQRAEQNEQEYEVCRYAERHAEHALGRQPHMLQEFRGRYAAVLDDVRHVAAAE